MSVTVFRAQALRAILIASVWIVIGSVQVVQAQDETDPLMIGYPANDSLLMLIAEGYAQSAVDIGITAETQAIDGTFADAQAAIAEGRIDIYLSYTTRAVRAVTGAPPPAEPDAFEAALEAAIEQELQEERAWFNNSIDAGPVVYAAPEFAEANSIATLEDLATLSQTRSIRLGLLSRWEGDPDAWSQLAAVYQIDINRHTTQIVTNPYTALQELGEVHDVVVLSALDAALLGLQDIDPALPVLDAVPLADPLEATGDYRLLLAFDLAVESDFLVSTFSMMSPDSADLLGVYPALEANAAVLGFEEADLLITLGTVLFSGGEMMITDDPSPSPSAAAAVPTIRVTEAGPGAAGEEATSESATAQAATREARENEPEAAAREATQAAARDMTFEAAEALTLTAAADEAVGSLEGTALAQGMTPDATETSPATATVTLEPTEASDTTANDQPTDVPVTFNAPRPDNVPDEINILGDGTAFIFHADSVGIGQRTLVELRVFFDNVLVTPTPEGEVTRIPAPQSGPRPRVGDPQAEPPEAQASESDILLAENVIAVLECFDLFENCGPKDAVIMQINRRNTWTWSILPVDDGTTGPRSLQLQLYAADEDGQPQDRLWRYDFSIDVAAAPGAATTNEGGGISGALLGGGAILLLALGVGVVMMMQRRQPVQPLAPPGEAPTVFISYKRDISWGIARTVRDRLVTLGAGVFIDVEDIHEGHFGEYIQQNIRDRQYFIPVLAPGTFDSEWVRKECELALELNKIIIPVLVNNFDLYGDELPESLRGLQDRNAVNLPAEYIDAGIERIARFIGLVD